MGLNPEMDLVQEEVVELLLLHPKPLCPPGQCWHGCPAGKESCLSFPGAAEQTPQPEASAEVKAEPFSAHLGSWEENTKVIPNIAQAEEKQQ